MVEKKGVNSTVETIELAVQKILNGKSEFEHIQIKTDDWSSTVKLVEDTLRPFNIKWQFTYYSDLGLGIILLEVMRMGIVIANEKQMEKVA